MSSSPIPVARHTAARAARVAVVGGKRAARATMWLPACRLACVRVPCSSSSCSGLGFRPSLPSIADLKAAVPCAVSCSLTRACSTLGSEVRRSITVWPDISSSLAADDEIFCLTRVVISSPRDATGVSSLTLASTAARSIWLAFARNSSTAACWCSLIVNLRACRVSLQWMVSLMIHRIGERAFTTRRQRCDEGGASAIASFWLRFSFAGFNVVLPRGEGGGHTHLLVLVHRRVAPRRQGFY